MSSNLGLNGCSLTLNGKELLDPEETFVKPKNPPRRVTRKKNTETLKIELELEREKIALERERLRFELEKLAVERERNQISRQFLMRPFSISVN
jgi:hypothetical protein